MLQLDYAAPAVGLRDLVTVYYRSIVDAAQGPFQERAAIAQLRIVSSGVMQARIGQWSGEAGPGIYVCGPTSCGSTYRVLDGCATILGVGILPAGWDAMTGADASAYANRFVPLAELPLRGDRSVLVPALADAPLAESSAMLDRYIASLLPHLEPQVVGFTHLVDSWLMQSLSPDVAALNAQCGLSQRQVERLAKQLFGMTPKMLARKYRALRAAHALACGDEKDAVISAFYDQSHMIRELKTFAGETPRQLQLGRADVDRLIDKRRAMAGAIHAMATKI